MMDNRFGATRCYGYRLWSTMRLTVSLALTVFTSFAALPLTAVAQDWFTISGYPELPGTDVVQISPVLTTWQQQVTLEVRTTRKSERTGYGGVNYRSYSGLAAVDCAQRKGWFLSLNFYSRPNWEGTATKSSSYKPEEAPMVFSEIPGMPAERLINAACAASR